MKARTLGPADLGRATVWRAAVGPATLGTAASPWLRLAALIVFAAAAWGAVGVEPAAAEEPAERNPREMIYAYKVWKLTDLLDLSEEQMPVFFARMKKIDDLELEVSETEREAARDIGRMLERGEVGDEELAQALRAYDETRSKRWEQLQAVRRDALSMLSVRQRCNYVVFEERFRDEMRQMIGRARDLRRGAGQEGGGEGRGRDESPGDSRGGTGRSGGSGGSRGSGGNQGSGR